LIPRGKVILAGSGPLLILKPLPAVVRALPWDRRGGDVKHKAAVEKYFFTGNCRYGIVPRIIENK